MTHIAWVIPLAPLAAFVLVIFLGDRLPGRGAFVSIAGFCLAALGGLWLLADVVRGGRADITYTWAVLGGGPLRVGFVVDPLSAVMVAMVGVVASLITIYSVGYMEGDPRYSRFFAYFSLFQFSMLFLVLADNFLFIYVAWELVGLCSYLLIGFWFERPPAARAALKAFITTRVGDFAMMIGILLLFLRVGSLRFDDVFRAVGAGALAGPALTAAALLVFGGAVGKSAQVPLHVWLPDAGERPHPRRDHGRGRGLPRGPGLPALLPHGRARSPHRGGLRGRCHRPRRGHHGGRGGRHQEGPRLFDDEPAGLHDAGAGHPGLQRRDVPPHHPRVLQGPPLPRGRERHPRGGHQRPQAHGRARPGDARDLLDLPYGHPGAHRDPPLRGIFQQGGDPPGGLRPRPRPVDSGARGRFRDVLLQGPAVLVCLRGPLPGGRGGGGGSRRARARDPAREPARHDGAPCDPRRLRRVPGVGRDRGHGEPLRALRAL